MFLKNIKNWLKSDSGITIDDARDSYKKYEESNRTGILKSWLRIRWD